MVIFDLRGFFQAGAKRRRVRASHVTQLHFQVGTVRTLQGYPSPTNRFPPQSPKTTLVSQVLEGTTDNCWLANTCQPFRTESPLLSPSASQSCLVLAGRSAAREQQFGARASERAARARGRTRPRLSHLGTHAARGRGSAAAGSAGGRTGARRRGPPSTSAPPAPPSPPEAGPARRLPTGAARPAHARRAAGRAGHTPPTHSVSLSLPALAPSPSGVSQSLPVAAGDLSASPFLPSPRRSLGLTGEGGRPRENGTDFPKVSRSICYPPGPRWGPRAAPRPSPKPGGPLQVERR